QRDRRGLCQLTREHRAGPRRRIGVALDLLDRIQVAQLQAAEVHAVRSGTHVVLVLSASGTRRYRGSTSSAGPKSWASWAWNLARGTCRSSVSGGTRAPAASRTDR